MGEEMSNLVILVRGSDGNEYILPGEIPSVEYAKSKYGEEFRNELLGEGLGCSMSFSFCSPKVKGCIDHLFCKPTMAAYRYVRSVRRKKEKERRQKLKEA